MTSSKHFYFLRSIFFSDSHEYALMLQPSIVSSLEEVRFGCRNGVAFLRCWVMFLLTKPLQWPNLTLTSTGLKEKPFTFALLPFNNTWLDWYFRLMCWKGSWESKTIPCKLTNLMALSKISIYHNRRAIPHYGKMCVFSDASICRSWRINLIRSCIYLKISNGERCKQCARRIGKWYTSL